MGGEGVFSSVLSLLWETAERLSFEVFSCWVFMSSCCKVLDVEARIVHGLMRVRPSFHGATGQFQ